MKKRAVKRAVPEEARRQEGREASRRQEGRCASRRQAARRQEGREASHGQESRCPSRREARHREARRPARRPRPHSQRVGRLEGVSNGDSHAPPGLAGRDAIVWKDPPSDSALPPDITSRCPRCPGAPFAAACPAAWPIIRCEGRTHGRFTGREAADLSRRAFLEGTSAALVIAATAPAAAAQTPATQAVPVAKTAISVTVNGTVQKVEVEDRCDAGRAAARPAEAHRHQARMRTRRVRRLHRDSRRQAGVCLQSAGGVGRRPHRADGRGPGAQRTTPSAPAGVRRARRAAVRILHVGPADERQGAARSQSASDAAGRQGGPRRATSAAARTTTATSRRSSRSVPAGPRRPLCDRREVRREPAERLPSAMAPLKTLGHPTPRIDAVERVTGAGRYTRDVVLPGMLYARILRSPHPHARIRSIDTSKAQALPGVKAHPHARELPRRLGRWLDRRRPAVQRRGQEDHDAAPLRVQQPGPVRR